MAFNPKEHMTNLKGKDYLEVKWRIYWFREQHPNGSISTDVINFDPLVIRAVIMADGGAILATGHGSAQLKQGAVWSGREIEKAETAAIGRALGHAGYGTQFDADDEGEHLADSPIERPQTREKAHSSGSTGNNGQSPETAEWTAKSVTIKTDKNGKQFLLYNCTEGKASGRGRDLLRNAGYDCETWDKSDQTHDLEPSATVTVKRDGQYWNVTAVQQLEGVTF